MTNITIEEAIARVTESGQKAASHERVTEIIEAICVPGFHVRQGDVLLTCLAPGTDHGDAIAERQLAPGTTQGSRHVAEGNVDIYARRGTDLTGPLLKVRDGGCTVTHPEHRHYVLPEGTEWGVTYERDLAQEELTRVMD